MIDEKKFMRRMYKACDKFCKENSTSCIRYEKPKRSTCNALNCGIYAAVLRQVWAEEDSADIVSEASSPAELEREARIAPRGKAHD